MKTRIDELNELISKSKNDIGTYIASIGVVYSHLNILETLPKLIEERVKYEIELAKIEK